MSDGTPAETPELRVPAHGKGKLRSGGSNGGAGGRPPDEVRQACREAFDRRIPKLEELADSEDPSVAMKAMEMLAKYGLGTTFTPTDTDGKTLRASGVLAVPVPITDDQWGKLALEQQSSLTKQKPLSEQLVS